MTSRLDMVPVPLLHNLKHNKVLHERIVLLHVVTENVPRIAPEERIQTAHLGDNFHSVRVRDGFMDTRHPASAGRLPLAKARLQHDGDVLFCRTGHDRGRQALAPQWLQAAGV